MSFFITGLFGDIENPQSFIEEVLQTLPTTVPAASSSSSSTN